MQSRQEEVSMVARWVRSVGFAALALTACGGNVKEDSGTPTEQLQASGPSKCKAACEKVIACGLDKAECDCGCACPAGASNCECGPCNCPANTEETPAKCESDCNEAVQKALASSMCAPAMLKLLDCLPSASCDSGQTPCKAETDAMKQCRQGSDHSTSPPVGNPGPQYPDAGGTVACALGSGSGTAPSTGSPPPPPGTVFCTSGWDSCSDGRSYQVECRITSGMMALGCTCQVDGVAQASFTATQCPSASSQVNSVCGWRLQ
jgi:hypothetical protein